VTKADLYVHNIGQLLTLRPPRGERELRRGEDLGDIGMVRDGALAAAGGELITAGTDEDVRQVAEIGPDTTTIDAGGAVVMPGFVDCHTHTVFARYRLDEYRKRVLGVPYAEIAKEGGGIAKSVSDIRETTESDLLDIARHRVEGCIRHGSTTIEIKSGYGLDLEHEMKQLRVIRRLAREYPACIVATFLGAHSLPAEFKDRREDFIRSVTDEMIPQVVAEGLAEYNDVFSETGVFTTDEAERILRAGQAAGLKARVHADELNDTGSAAMAARIGAVSADHLPRISPEGIAAMAASDTVGVLLPGTSFGLPSVHFAPARRMVESGMAIAIASDFNPGSSPSESMPMMIAIACSHLRLSPEEAIAASTYNPAFVVGREREVGSLEPGKRADFLILGCADYMEIPYRFGVNPVRRVFIQGREWTCGT
jgi:imidazolonepropionase